MSLEMVNLLLLSYLGYSFDRSKCVVDINIFP